MLKKILLIAIPFVVATGFNTYDNMGGSHSESELEKLKESTNYNSTLNRFENPNQQPVDEMVDKVFSWDTISNNHFKKDAKAIPPTPLPLIDVSLSEFLAPGEPKVIWLGHSSFLVRAKNVTLLIDPVFDNASPLPFGSNRFQEAPIQLSELPKIDIVLISHDHYDHLEDKSIKHLAKTNAKFIVPLGIGTHLRHWGVKTNNINETDWWDKNTYGNLTITTTPSQHYSGRKGFAANKTLWASYVISDGNTQMFFSGDTGYGEHFKQINQKLGDIDVAFLENGQYHDITRYIHMHPEDTAKAALDLNAKKVIPIHWGTFALSAHSWSEPPTK